MKKLLLTGASGFTGYHLYQEAKLAGFVVIPLISDISDIPAMKAEILNIKPDYVIHLAAISAVSHSQQEDLYKVNLMGALNLLESLALLPSIPEKIILVSSANVYGNISDESISEELYPHPVNHYAMSKLAMEMMAINYFPKLPIVITRPFNYTGVGHDLRFVIPKIINHFKQKLELIELGNIDVLREYNDVRTVCQIYLKLLTYGEIGQIYNICSGRAFTLREIIHKLRVMTKQLLEVNINSNLIRSNEVFVLSGNPSKLQKTIGEIQFPPIDETLLWMLNDKN